MQPVYHPLVNIFGHEIRHTVPLFQRPYVWSKEENWEPLWDDLKSLASRVLKNVGKGPVAGHFLGTVVLEQTPSQSGSIVCREVIDGQQRLTTLQIILKATQHSLVALSDDLSEEQAAVIKSLRVSARQIGALVINPAYAEEEEKYKVWPTNEDREAFSQVMDAQASADVDQFHSRMAQAYHFFFASITNWLQGEDMFDRSIAFTAAMKDHLRLIVLDLDNTDEPQAIFETLNAHGAPLLPADLMKNWLLWQAQKQKKNIEQLYNSYWRAFDKEPDYWRAKIGTGHASRARVDTFLQYWLTRRARKTIATKHLYDQFLRHASPAEDGDHVDVAAIMSDIQRDSDRFILMDRPEGPTRLATFFRRLKTMDVSVFYPLLLELLGRKGSNAADRNKVSEHLESYLVRRMVCGEQTRGYGTLALTLLETLNGVDDAEPAAPFLRDFLSKLADADWWPDDETFKSEWCNRKFYGGLRRERVLMLLQALEEQYQRSGSKGEPIVSFDFSTLQIEHILPQEWEKHWPLAKSDPNGVSRLQHLHAMGNLTLVSGKLNPSLSHAAWLDEIKGQKTKMGKRSALKEHSKLQLNSRLISKHQKRWDESTIDQRGLELFEIARTIWASPLVETTH